MTKPEPGNTPHRGPRLSANASATQKRFLPGPTHFLGIGINDYPEWNPLNNAVRDVQVIFQLLTEHYQLDKEHAQLLINQQATRSAMLKGIKTVMQQAQENDSVIVYFAGHGHLDPHSSRGFLVPFDGAADDDATYIRNTTLKDFFQDSKAKHILFLSDACFSGSLLVESRSKGAQKAAQELEKRKSRWVICSGRHKQEVQDGPPGQHSPFAEAVMNVLREVDRPAITSAYLGQSVLEETQHNYREQLPDYGPVYGVGDQRGQFVFWPQGRTAKAEERQAPEVSLPPPPPESAPQGPISFEQFVGVVNELLAEDQAKKAIVYLRKSLVDKSDLQNDLIGLNARITRLNRRERDGVITENRAGVERNRINAAVQSLLEDLKAHQLRSDAQWPDDN